MKKFKIIDFIVQTILLAIAIFWFINDKGIAWWGKLTNEIVMSLLVSRLPSFIINIWQLFSASVHIRNTKYNFKKARIIFFSLLTLAVAAFSVFFWVMNDEGEKIRAMAFLSASFLLIAIYYLTVCIMETIAIKNKEQVVKVVHFFKPVKRFFINPLISFFSESIKSTIMKNKKVVIAGGTGFIGQALAEHFGKDNHIVIISRQSVNGHNNNYNQNLLLPSQGYNITYRRWDGEHQEKHWTSELEGADIVINLAGKSVNCRYTEKNRQAIFDSRVNATNAIGEAIRHCTIPPKLWINAASATIYRHAEDHPQDEYNGEFHDDFSVRVCKRWEKTFTEQRTPFTRKIALRMAITLGHGGVMAPYFNLLKFKLGGKQGNGRQMYSWVHMEDVCNAIEWMNDHKEMEGVYNLSAPNPVTNDFFMKTFRTITGHKIGLPAYTWMLAIGAKLIGTEKELLLKSRWVVPTKLLETGFQFKFAHLYDAAKDIVSKTERKKYHLF